MILNRQRAIPVDLVTVREFTRRVKEVLNLKRRDFNVCLVDDEAICELNSAYRGLATPTDVLSFPWQTEHKIIGDVEQREFHNFLGDIVISVEAARRSARAERRTLQTEISWLILHGTLHLLGYDHETDRGEMTVLELSLRRRLGRIAEDIRAG